MSEEPESAPKKKSIINTESLTRIARAVDKEWENMDAADKRYVLSRFLDRARSDGVNVEGL